jgi:hypothetical protein
VPVSSGCIFDTFPVRAGRTPAITNLCPDQLKNPNYLKKRIIWELCFSKPKLACIVLLFYKIDADNPE